MSANESLLVVPHLALVEEYRAALETGWSPSVKKDDSATTLARLNADPEDYLKMLAGTVFDPPRVPLRIKMFERWVWDGAFCGFVRVVFQPGRDDLPESILARLGYNIVPWKRGLGYAPEAVRQVLPELKSEGLGTVLAACSPGNRESCRVMEKLGAEVREERVFPEYFPEPRRIYALAL